MAIYVPRSGKTTTTIDIHFLPSLPRNTKYLITDGQVHTAFYQCCQATRVHFMTLGGINRSAWGTKLLLTPVLASLVDSTSLCHILKAQDCSLSSNGCFTRLRLPTRPPPIDSIRNIAGTEEKYPKNQQHLSSL